jgi:hypothetical protein
MDAVRVKLDNPPRPDEQIDLNQASELYASADKKLSAAKKIRALDEAVAYQLAYEAMLKVSWG